MVTKIRVVLNRIYSKDKDSIGKINMQLKENNITMHHLFYKKQRVKMMNALFRSKVSIMTTQKKTFGTC